MEPVDDMARDERGAPAARIATADPFLLGVNYWPRRKAMTWWSDFDADEVDEEFALIADLGMHVVRIFLLWDDWQPTRDTVSASCLANLRRVCDLAQRHGLRLDVTFFTGHMSGPNWSPGLLLRDGPPPARPHVRHVVSGGRVVASAYRNPYHDPFVTAVLPKLVDVGASGAMMWCFADYHEDLWNQPPCDEARHERHFGLVRPDGSLKPHAEAIRAFARSAPRRLQDAVHHAELDVTMEEYYADPARHAQRLFEAYLARHGL